MQLSNQGVDGPVLVTAMQTSLQSVVRHEVDEDENAGRFSMFCPPYAANELQPVYGNHAFGMNAQCFVRQAASDVEDDSTDGFCVFLFEVSFLISKMTDNKGDVLELIRRSR